MTTQPREEMKTKGNRTIGDKGKQRKNETKCSQAQCKTVKNTKKETENQQIC